MDVDLHYQLYCIAGLKTGMDIEQYLNFLGLTTNSIA